MIGQTLAHYEITALLGKGGMGEVYRATDRKLGREVAIKLLPPQLVRDPERVARFEREARTLAALQHPHVASVYGFEQEGEHRFLVMELVEGESLASRLERGAMPVDEAIAVARQLCLGLEAAHARGLVHRDLKPANVQLGTDGQAKILDFGLARAVTDEPDPADLAHSPTITAGMTAAGTLLGTAAYMSPEQARGKALDARTDIWAFGCVLYEMLSGEQAYGGETISDVIARILEREVDLGELPAGTPPALRRLLARCLAKDPAQRLHHIADARLELEAVGEEPAPVAGAAGRSWLPWAVAAVLLVGLVAVALWPRPVPEAPLLRFSVAPPSEGVLQDFELAPDGSMLVMVSGERLGHSSLWLRHFDQIKAVQLEGTEGAQFPFWSPDSRSIGFFADGRLRRLDLDGGGVRTLAEAPNGRGGAWSPTGVILFAPEGLSSLYQVPVAGGEPTAVTALEADALLESEASHRFPHFLPDGDHFTYVAQAPAIGGGMAFLSSLSEPGRRVVLSRELGEVYAVKGQLLIAREGTLLARPFDLGERRFTGEGTALASNIAGNIPVTGRSTFSVSSNGVLAHRSQEIVPSRLVWHDRYGRAQEELLAAGLYAVPTLSPSLRRVAFVRDGDLWMRDLERGSEQRLVEGDEIISPASWASDDELVYTRDHTVYRQRVDRTVEPEIMLDGGATGPGGEALVVLFAYQRPGAPLILQNWDSRTNLDLWILGADGSPEPLVVAEGMQYRPAVSPDGRWMAYESSESGRGEVVVQGLVDRDIRRVISSGGGIWPAWGPEGRQLYFLADSGQLMVAELEPGAELRTSVPRALFQAPAGVPDMFVMVSATPQLLAVGEEGFLFNVGVAGNQPGLVSVVWNWDGGR